MLNPVVIIADSKIGQKFKQFTSFKDANSFMSDIVKSEKILLNSKENDEWYIETENKSYSLRYLPYED